MSETTDIKIDYVHASDVEAILAVERGVYEYEDPDFQVPAIPEFAVTEERLREVVSKYKNKANQTNESRVIVARRGKQTVGCAAYEQEESSFLLTMFIAADDEVRSRLLKHVIKKCSDSDKRRTLELDVADGDWTRLKFFMNNEVTGNSKKGGFKVKRVPRAADNGSDVWELSYTVPETAEKKRKSGGQGGGGQVLAPTG